MPEQLVIPMIEPGVVNKETPDMIEELALKKQKAEKTEDKAEEQEPLLWLDLE